MKFLVNLDLSKNQIQNAVIQPLAAAPSSGVLGQIYFNSTDHALYQHDGTSWKKVGVVYNQTSDVGKVITGLGSDGSVTTTSVVNLEIDGYTPVEEGVITEGMTLEEALYALDDKLKDVISEGGEPNQEAWSYIQVGTSTISATLKKDTFKMVGSGAVSISADNNTKTVTVGVTADTAMSDTSVNPVQNKVIKAAIDAKYTKPTTGIPKTDLASAVQTSLGKADTSVQKDGTVAMTGNLQMGSKKITGLADGTVNTDAASVGQVNSAIGNALEGYLSLGGGTMTGAIAMGNNHITGLPDASAAGQPVTYTQLPATPVMTGISISRDDDSVTFTESFLNVRTGATSSDTDTLGLANAENAGLMSPSDVAALSDLGQRVEALEGTTVRLLYSTKENPTASEIQAFVQASGYTDASKWTGIAVVIAGTYHIWHYYGNSVGWRDDGVDTVSQFTNGTLGTIKGVNTDGKVYAENDGTGSIVGWDALKTRVTNVENNKADKTTVDSIPVVKTATGTIGTSSTTANVAYSGTVIDTFVKDNTGERVMTDIKINANTVTFTVAAAPSAALTCVVVYI